MPPLRAATLASDEQASPDVGPDNTHFANVNGASEAGLAQRFGDGTFRSAEGVRRDQMASFVVRLLTGIVEERWG